MSLLLFLQNWVAYESLEKAAKLNINQQTLDFPNDEQPKLAYHNAFCQVRNWGLLKVVKLAKGEKKFFSCYFAYCVVHILLCCYLQNKGSVIASFREREG